MKIENVPNEEFEKRYHYSHFTVTNLFGKSAGQSINPFLDIQPVTSKSLLQGISLDIKKGGESGGYLIFKLHTFDVSFLIYF